VFTFYLLIGQFHIDNFLHSIMFEIQSIFYGFYQNKNFRQTVENLFNSFYSDIFLYELMNHFLF